MTQIKHVAIIMDGNGRWAQQRRRPRSWGHIKGASNISSIVEAGIDAQLSSLTLYAFSSENWSRPKHEISILMKLLNRFLLRNQETIAANNIRFNVIGRFRESNLGSIQLIEELIDRTKSNTGLKLNFAFDYGGRQELLDAFNNLLQQRPAITKLTEQDIQEQLYDPAVKEIDLLIRTGGDERISNFLLWQCAYAEMKFTKTPWPIFTKEEFQEIISHYSKVEKRFGGLEENSSYQKNSKLAYENKKEVCKP